MALLKLLNQCLHRELYNNQITIYLKKRGNNLPLFFMLSMFASRKMEPIMQFIDTHTHLYLEEFDHDRDEVIERAISTGVNKLLLPNIDSKSTETIIDMVYKYPGICYPMIGVHPTSVKGDYRQELDSVIDWLGRENFIAIGEIGLDLYWDKTFIKEQSDIFNTQIEIALKHDLPVVIHSRDSFLEIFKLLEAYQGSGLKGVFHAFTGDTGEAEHIIESGFYLGIGGIVTFKNSGLDKVVTDIGIDHLLLETDSPYLSPTPHRGARNESSYIPLIAKRVAEATETTIEEVSKVTTGNAIKLFNIK